MMDVTKLYQEDKNTLVVDRGWCYGYYTDSPQNIEKLVKEFKEYPTLATILGFKRMPGPGMMVWSDFKRGKYALPEGTVLVGQAQPWKN